MLYVFQSHADGLCYQEILRKEFNKLKINLSMWVEMQHPSNTDNVFFRYTSDEDLHQLFIEIMQNGGGVSIEELFEDIQGLESLNLEELQRIKQICGF